MIKNQWIDTAKALMAQSRDLLSCRERRPLGGSLLRFRHIVNFPPEPPDGT